MNEHLNKIYCSVEAKAKLIGTTPDKYIQLHILRLTYRHSWVDSCNRVCGFNQLFLICTKFDVIMR